MLESDTTRIAPQRTSAVRTARGRRFCRAAAAAAAVLGLVVGGTALPTTAAADSAVSATDGGFTVSGSGWGHGYGMSQYGAYGAAKAGLSWSQILDFYYPGTTSSRLPANNTIRVWITSDTDDDLRVAASKGLTLHAGSKKVVLPTGSRYVTWRIIRSDSRYRLQYRGSSGSYKTRSTTLSQAKTWWLSNSAKKLTVLLPGSRRREYRGSMLLVKDEAGGRTVSKVTMENYVRSVVPSEMPTSWDPDAVRTQAVAARTYAARMRADAPSGRGYHICDTTACQVYGGVATTVGGVRTARETAAGNRAVAATSRRVLRYQGTYAFTQFSSSNGGHTATGSQPYLMAFPDPYDDDIRSQDWSRTITAKAIAGRWSSVGTVRQVRILKRDGQGRWGGRVTSMSIIGSKRTVTVTGSAFQSAFGLKSRLFDIS